MTSLVLFDLRFQPFAGSGGRNIKPCLVAVIIGAYESLSNCALAQGCARLDAQSDAEVHKGCTQSGTHT